jgi:2-succinyl-6-hydroxy-2,4-cyclohexadiene-1-carboxylate synthase
MILIALHGFFGVPSDWDPVIDLHADLEVVTPDLSIWATRAEVKDFETFAKSMNRSVRMLSSERSEPVMIAGYSMGARLAAFCVLADPELYRSALLISVNPGLLEQDKKAREARLGFDQQWAQRMRKNPWEETWTAWNQQDVLRPGSRAIRQAELQGREDKISRGLEGRREAWARAMEIWSLGHQPDFRKPLVDWSSSRGGVPRPLTVMTGTDDLKFTQLTRDWLNPYADSPSVSPSHVRHRLILGAGHRVLNEAPEDVASEISTLLKML